ncbi:MAG: hypothetical protein ACKOED_06565 [Aestuariivirga sp.]|uniref:hypothetical protein n=1 Tax=Aestuariivirga sp. TaxID=2650926 RepID=UPI0038CFFA0E
MPERLSDILTYVLSAGLAVAVLVFAATKIIALHGMEDPPANMGLNFPPLQKRELVMDGPGIADPITTRSLGTGLRTRISPSQAGSERQTSQFGGKRYELLTVIDGVAFVTVDSDADKTLVPVIVGTKLPGGLRVDAITQRDGVWNLVAGELVIEQSPAADQ